MNAVKAFEDIETSDELREYVKAKLGREGIDALQEAVNEMVAQPRYRQYVQQAKLHLLDGESGRRLDSLIRLGVVHTRGA